ncbi:MAG: SPOR domain-containing protein [Bacteroidota bacterium]
MIRKLFLFITILGFSTGFSLAQSIVKTSDLFKRSDNNSRAGQLNIIQDPAIDTLISRYILVNKNLKEKNGYYGMDGFRIQIYRSSVRNAREESNKASQEFIDKFQDISAYRLYDNPGWYMVRVGDFRTKTEATKLFLIISKEFPDAYIVPDFINFPELNTK